MVLSHFLTYSELVMGVSKGSRKYKITLEPVEIELCNNIGSEKGSICERNLLDSPC